MISEIEDPRTVDGKKKPKLLLVEPIYRQQPQESDKEYHMFLMYRDMSYEDRGLLPLSRQLTGNPQAKTPHQTVANASAKWQWTKRIESWECFIQEHHSDKQEKVILELKSEVEVIVLKLVRKIKKISEIKILDEVNDPEMKRDMAIVEGLVGKGNAGKFMLDAYKTVIGEKISLNTSKLESLEWKI